MNISSCFSLFYHYLVNRITPITLNGGGWLHLWRTFHTWLNFVVVTLLIPMSLRIKIDSGVSDRHGNDGARALSITMPESVRAYRMIRSSRWHKQTQQQQQQILQLSVSILNIKWVAQHHRSSSLTTAGLCWIMLWAISLSIWCGRHGWHQWWRRIRWYGAASVANV